MSCFSGELLAFAPGTRSNQLIKEEDALRTINPGMELATLALGFGLCVYQCKPSFTSTVFHGSWLALLQCVKCILIAGPCVINFKNYIIVKDYQYKEEFCRTKLSRCINVPLTQTPQTKAFLLKEIHGYCNFIGWEANEAFSSFENNHGFLPTACNRYSRWSMC